SQFYSSCLPMPSSLSSTLSLHVALPIFPPQPLVEVAVKLQYVRLPHRSRDRLLYSRPFLAADFSLRSRPDVCLDFSDDFRNTIQDRKSTRLNSSHVKISYAVFCLKKKIT